MGNMTLKVLTKNRFTRAVSTGAITIYTHVHGPCARLLIFVSRKHGPCPQAVCTSHVRAW